MRAATFYDRYHLKNQKYFKVIGENNFTYFYILRTLHLDCKNQIGRKVLDVGCGVGTMALYLNKQGAEVKGIDISPRAIEIANQAKSALKLKNVEFKVQELNKGKADYDLVICSEVIEHIPDDQKFASLLASNIKKSGRLLLTTPSSANWLYRLGFYTTFDKEVGHLRRYTESSIKELLESVGFKVVAIRSVEGPLRNLLFTTKLGFLIRFIKGPLVPVFHFFDTASAWLFGASDIQVVAKKT